MESVFLIFSIDKKLLLQSNPAIQSFSIDRKNVMSTIKTTATKKKRTIIFRYSISLSIKNKTKLGSDRFIL